MRNSVTKTDGAVASGVENKGQPCPGEKRGRGDWWKEAVVYQIYPRSFRDSDGDGIGDLRGVIDGLDYVRSLGVDVIWLNPIFASPNDDNGYDISDYREIMADFGTMADFDELLRQVHALGMRLVLDLVVNHSSDEHPWFVRARRSRESPYYHYYHWWPAERGLPPVRRSYFDENGDAWRYNSPTDSYYLHYFSAKQPDLNWENPAVRREIYDLMRFWLDKGIDGFRLDSIPFISKDTAFPEVDSKEYPDLFHYYAQGPRLHDYLQEMHREVLSRYPVMTVGEGSETPSERAALFVDPARCELDMLYGFGPSVVRNHTRPDSRSTGIRYSLLALKRMFTEWDRAVGCGWPAIYLGNHDQPRMVSRFGSDIPALREPSAKMLTTFLLTMRGTPYWYAGDELGMTNIKFNRIEDYRDIDTRNAYERVKRDGGDLKAFMREQKQVARDNARTPFPWNAARYAGFTAGTPWIGVHPNYRSVNVEAEERDPDSVLNYFRRAIAVRKANRTLVYGRYRMLDADNAQVYTYLREEDGDRLLVVLNFSPRPAKTETGLEVEGAEILLANYPDHVPAERGDVIALRPFEAAVYRLPRTAEG